MEWGGGGWGLHSGTRHRNRQRDKAFCVSSRNEDSSGRRHLEGERLCFLAPLMVVLPNVASSLSFYKKMITRLLCFLKIVPAWEHEKLATEDCLRERGKPPVREEGGSPLSSPPPRGVGSLRLDPASCRHHVTAVPADPRPCLSPPRYCVVETGVLMSPFPFSSQPPDYGNFD